MPSWNVYSCHLQVMPTEISKFSPNPGHEDLDSVQCEIKHPMHSLNYNWMGVPSWHNLIMRVSKGFLPVTNKKKRMRFKENRRCIYDITVRNSILQIKKKIQNKIQQFKCLPPPVRAMLLKENASWKLRIRASWLEACKIKWIIRFACYTMITDNCPNMVTRRNSH